MITAITVAYAILGLIVGSFLNVLILRHGARAVTGRSACMACGKQLTWIDLIPVFSWIFLRGRCRFCHASISIQYPLVEISTAILFALIGTNLTSPIHTLNFLIAGLLIAIAVYDIRHTIIPDEWVYPAAFLALVVSTVDVFQYGGTDGLALLFIAGPLAALPLFGLWLFSKGEWMGLGDAKLALVLGWLLGPVVGPLSVFLAFVFGAVVGLTLIFFSSQIWKRIKELSPIQSSQRTSPRFTMKSEIPFGPFLILSCLILWILTSYGIDPLELLVGASH